MGGSYGPVRCENNVVLTWSHPMEGSKTSFAAEGVSYHHRIIVSHCHDGELVVAQTPGNLGYLLG